MSALLEQSRSQVIHSAAELALKVGGETLEPFLGFYYRHMAEVVRLSTAPDERRNDDPTEASKHFIDMDHYSEDNPFG